MKNKWNKNILQLGVMLALAGCACILFAEVIKQWKSIFGFFGNVVSAMTPIIIGLVIAFLLNPIMIYVRRGLSFLVCKIKKELEYDTVYRKVKVPALILTVLLFLGLLVGLLWLVIPRVYESLTDLVNNTEDYISSAEAWIKKVFAQNQMIEDKLSQVLDYAENNVFTILKDKIMPNLDTIVKTLSSGVVVGIKAVMNFLIGLIVMIYLLMSKDVLLAQCKKVIYCLFSKKTGNKIMEGCSYANVVFGGFINGKILDSCIIGIICFIFTSAVHMRYAVLISVVVGVTNIIPFFGPFIGAVPGALLALMDDPIMFVVFVIWIIVLQQFDGNILGPKILGESTGLSSFMVIVAILLFGGFMGIPGMIIGVPVWAVICTGIRQLREHFLKEKHLPVEDELYMDIESIDPESHTIIKLKKEDLKEQQKESKKHTKEKNIEKGNE